MDAGADCEEVDAKLVHETIQLLSSVTYIRIVLDRIIWHIAPKFISEEFRHSRSPRNRGQIYVTYQIPALAKASPRGSSKIFKVLAKDVSENYVIFNEKHVTLCKITSAIIDNWATNNCEMKFFYNSPKKKTTHCFARCSIPMSKILVLPFSFDSDKVPLDLTSDLASCRGCLKIVMQLGSRMQHFQERVEPMRNPTTSVSPLSFLNPSAVKSPRDVDERHKKLLSANHGRYLVEKHEKAAIGSFDDEDDNANYSRIRLSPTVDHVVDSGDDHRRQIATGEYSPVSFHEPSSRRNKDYYSATRRRLLLNGNGGENAGQTFMGGADFLPPYDKASKESQATSKRSAIDQQAQQHLSSERSSPSARTRTDFERHTNGRRRPTVAERLKLSVGESIGVANSAQHPQFPIIPKGGYWLQVAVRQAKHLPFVKSKKDGQLHKPNCYITYRNNDRVFASDVVPNSLNPIWNWTTQLYVPPDRKNVVFKIWHKLHGSSTNRSRVIGFVAVELPSQRPIVQVASWYDIMDLSRSSSGQIQISFGQPSALPPSNTDSAKDSEPVAAPDNGVTWGDDLFLSPKSSDDSYGQKSPPPLINLDDDMTTKRNHRPNVNSNKRLVPALSPFSPVFGGHADLKSSDKEVNTSFFVAQADADQNRRDDSFDPFVDLTSRSFLSGKLRNNLDELNQLLDRFRRRSASAHAAAPSSRNT